MCVYEFRHMCATGQTQKSVNNFQGSILLCSKDWIQVIRLVLQASLSTEPSLWPQNIFLMFFKIYMTAVGQWSCTQWRFISCIALIKRWLASSQAGSRGGATRTGEFWEEESSVCSHHPDASKMKNASLIKVPSHMANTDKKPELIGQPWCL